MKIEEGKYYRTRDGRKVGPIVFDSNKPLCGTHVLETTSYWYTKNGRCMAGKEHPDDLIAEWADDDQDTLKRWKDLTPEEKGALLLAHHEGKVIEFCEHEDEDWEDKNSPVWLQTLIYRIKPELKRETVTLYGDRFYDFSDFSDFKGCYPDYRITFDLVDGDPDTDSIRMEKL